MYTISSPAPTPAHVPIKPPKTQVYSRPQNPLVSSPTLATSSSNPIQSDNLPIALRKGKCQCTHPISSFVSYNHLLSSSCSFVASLNSISFTNTVREALSQPGWCSAMVEEMQALDDNDLWDLVPLLLERRLLVVVRCLQ